MLGMKHVVSHMSFSVVVTFPVDSCFRVSVLPWHAPAQPIGLTRKLRGNDARPQRRNDKQRENNPDAVGDNDHEDLRPGRVANPEVGASSKLGEAVEEEDGFPHGHRRHREGQRYGMAALLVVLKSSTPIERKQTN